MKRTKKTETNGYFFYGSIEYFVKDFEKKERPFDERMKGRKKKALNKR